MPVAEVIAIGTELLLGEIQDTNTRYIARQMRDIGVDLFRTTIVGDNIHRIMNIVNEARSRAQIVITTGGLGPTVDDPTREAIALALEVALVFKPELWQQIQERFIKYGRKATDNNRRQAYIPGTAKAIANPVGTAPAFYVDDGNSILVSLPGVPSELENLMELQVIPLLKRRFNLTGTIRALVLRTAGYGESQIDELIGDLETYSNPTVGLLAHPGQVDIRITAKAKDSSMADQMIAEMNEKIQTLLGDAIYGKNEDTLEQSVLNLLNKSGVQLHLLESGFSGGLSPHFLNANIIAEEISPEIKDFSEDEIVNYIKTKYPTKPNTILVLAHFAVVEDHQSLFLLFRNFEISCIQRSYAGPPAQKLQWGLNLVLDYTRRNLMKMEK